MSTFEELVDRHITEYNSRLKHFDEMAEKAELLEDHHDIKELAELKAHRIQFHDYLQEQRHNPSQRLLDNGPMAIWDVIADRLEKLVEKVSR